MDPHLHQSAQDTEDLFCWNEQPRPPQIGLDFFSQPPNFPTAASSPDGHDSFLPRRPRHLTPLTATAPSSPDGQCSFLPQSSQGGALDLNSQADELPNNMSYLELIRSPTPNVLSGSRRGQERAIGRAAGPARPNGRGAGSSSGMVPNQAAPSQPVGHPRRRGSVPGRGAGGRPPAPAAMRQFRSPRPSLPRSKLAATTPRAGDEVVADEVHESASPMWSQNPYDEEDEDAEGHEASMDSSSSSDDDEESDEDSSSSGDDETKRNALNQLELLQQFGAVACMFGMYHESTFMNKTKKLKTGLTGKEWVMRTLDNPTACYNMFRMSRELFYRLHDELVMNYGLRSSNKMGSVESLAMFLWIIGAPQSIRQAENRFERSTETVSRKFHEVLRCVYRLSAQIIKPRDPLFRTVHPRLQSPRFAPYFDDCIGAIDGTHIPVVVPSSKLPQHVGRYGYSTQNVLAVCDFDMRFTFAVAGWPGSVHDMRVFNDALSKYHDVFPHPPPGKFYLVDSGYPNQPGYLAPYKGTKYHVPEFRQGPRPKGKKEVFNYVHSSLRNVIERAFGVLKMKWRILLDLPSYPMGKQSKIILACMALHNFIRESAMRDQDFDKCDEDEDYMPMVEDSSSQQNGGNNQLGDEDVDMNAFRDAIASALSASGE